MAAKTDEEKRRDEALGNIAANFVAQLKGPDSKIRELLPKQLKVRFN